MPECGQVLYCLANAIQIVNPGCWQCRAHRVRHRRKPVALFGTEDARGAIPPCRKLNRDAVDPALNHAPDRQFHSLGVGHGRRKENLVVVLHREMFERLNDFREKRIGDFGDDKAQKAAPPGN